MTHYVRVRSSLLFFFLFSFKFYFLSFYSLLIQQSAFDIFTISISLFPQNDFKCRFETLHRIWMALDLIITQSIIATQEWEISTKIKKKGKLKCMTCGKIDLICEIFVHMIGAWQNIELADYYRFITFSNWKREDLPWTSVTTCIVKFFEIRWKQAKNEGKKNRKR